ncbi:MAG: ADP-glyceromanno-heptose 6-epimerase [Bdellovibrionales bacterium RIFOXYD12_FULL_39_22]|nr:MAG: ADP-glyceromanno-heptose 6-epimerase [Bdellovibrionales bacterium RIFOXYB1_FULL_39_21]OFZ41179.1 MAG: ADP-glyceromanno-heptose 6-epimerase [Bdellovibrionales bacterium RIFOXYC12_FULL_39_17]OFZ44933.1 MAG: ADP-glyceromanno-heptose 6-epimerase [Bdellovibrionales bacterium RIFOXYC1_FULL_39_130]OFZ74380.1 MAG: ADP-glyceromanno-heptose 6-epimerase [Bdellovibrionales bacterium RIFOXYD1_FULL_39_84]OFZ92382.1 MAG: ADP-glyceromanno-heptose 6-epimerase [Bdellovibrionales bacterium RIFOXYD12_FULL_
MAILITGGAGFIGSVLAHELSSSGRNHLIIVDRLHSTDKWRNLRGMGAIDYIHADELFDKAHERLLSSVKFIFHMGACSSTTEMDVDYLMRNNVDYSKRLFSWATQRNVPIIYASSAATYGDGELGYDDNQSALGNLLPLNPYGFSKQLFDQWVLSQKRYPTFWIGLKFFNVYGPNEYHKGSMRSMVHKAFEQIQSGQEVRLFRSHKEGFADGEQLRDFIYVKDVVRAMVELMTQKRRGKSNHSGIYNLGTGKARSFNDLVRSTFSAMDKKVKITYIDMPEEIKNQYQYFTQAEMQKFHRLLPKFKFSTLEAGVTDYVRNYLSRPNPHYIA